MESEQEANPCVTEEENEKELTQLPKDQVTEKLN